MALNGNISFNPYQLVGGAASTADTFVILTSNAEGGEYTSIETSSQTIQFATADTGYGSVQFPVEVGDYVKIQIISAEDGATYEYESIFGPVPENELGIYNVTGGSWNDYGVFNELEVLGPAELPDLSEILSLVDNNGNTLCTGFDIDGGGCYLSDINGGDDYEYLILSYTLPDLADGTTLTASSWDGVVLTDVVEQYGTPAIGSDIDPSIDIIIKDVEGLY